MQRKKAHSRRGREREVLGRKKDTKLRVSTESQGKDRGRILLLA